MAHLVSAGLLMYRIVNKKLEVFLAHPGGPFFKKRDWGAWSIPKGSKEPDENLMETAIREFNEETGLTSSGPYIPLGYVIQRGGKTVYGWGFEGNWNGHPPISSNRFEMEWPPKSGIVQSFPETDEARFFNPDLAKKKINRAQAAFIDRLKDYLQFNNQL